MSFEALPAEILNQILDFSRPHDFESLAMTCKKVYVTASYHLAEEHWRCKQNMHQMDAANVSHIRRLILLASPLATLYWLHKDAAQYPIDQLQYVTTISLDFPSHPSDGHLFALLEEIRSTIPQLYAALQQKSCDIFQVLSRGTTLHGGLEESSERLQDAYLSFCPTVLCQLALTGLTSNAAVLNIANKYLAYMYSVLDRLLMSPPNTGFLRNIREVVIQYHGPYHEFGGRALSALFKLPQLRAITIQNVTACLYGSKSTRAASLRPLGSMISHNVTVLVLIETIWEPDTATRLLSLFPELRSFVWQPGWHGYCSPASPLDDNEEEIEGYATWFDRYREEICAGKCQGADRPAEVRSGNGDARTVSHDAGRNLLQLISDLYPSGDSASVSHSPGVIAPEGLRGSRRAPRRGRGSQRSGYVSRSATNQQFVGGAADLATDNLVNQANSDEELDMDGPCLSDADEVQSLDWSHPDPFQPSVLLAALCRSYGDQLEHLAVSVFGRAQAADQIAREDTVIHFLGLVKLTHLDLDTRILRPRKGSRYQHVSIHRVLPPSMKQLALTILHCVLSVELQNLLGQLPMHKSSLPRLESVFVRVLMSETRAVSTEDEGRFERLRDELAHVGISLRWIWVNPGTEVKPGLDWDDSRDIMPSTYSMEPDPR